MQNVSDRFIAAMGTHPYIARLTLDGVDTIQGDAIKGITFTDGSFSDNASVIVGYLAASCVEIDLDMALIAVPLKGRSVTIELGIAIDGYPEWLLMGTCKITDANESDGVITVVCKDAAAHAFEDTYETEKGELQALGRQHIPYPAGHVLTMRTTLPGIVTCNMTNVLDIDGTNAEDLTRATLTCRQQMDDIVRFLREFVPGYENCFIVSSASLIGIRETRHFKGKYTITKDDIWQAKVFDDYVVKDAYFNFDVHNITGAGLDETGVQYEFTQKKGYTIPYGCLLPVKTENLLLCGRNISGTHMAHSNFRAMPICVGTGEAAGAAAAIAVRQNCAPSEVKPEEIRKIIGV